MVSRTYSPDELPQFQVLRVGARKKYPWLTTHPGHGFKFDAEITLAGARSQVANFHRATQQDGIERRFIIRLDVEHNIWAIRIDGLPIETREQWRKRRALPQGSEHITDEMFAEMVPAGDHVVDVPGAPGYVQTDEDPI